MEEKRAVVKEYSNKDITVVWKPDTCIHSKHCWKDLVQVFNPKRSSWINMDGASTERIKKQVDACPSGALSYISITDESEGQVHLETKVESLPNGPLLVYGTLHITHSDGTIEKKNKTTAFCRCGASNNKPYCDGAHIELVFKG